VRGHYLQHVPFEKPGIIEDWFNEHNGVLTRTQLYRQPEFPSLDELDFLLVLGGPMGANDEADYPWLVEEKKYIESAIERSIPTLGVCLGAQLIASVLGSDVYPASYEEAGWMPISLTQDGAQHPLLRGWPDEVTVFHWHGDTFDLPDSATRVAESKGCDNQAFVYEESVIGLQFHTEMRADDIRYMLDFLGESDMKGPYVQDRNTIRNGLDNFQQPNALMKKTLNELLIPTSE
jgi:GMP synthase-like glutamine amidotransferase